MFAQATLPSRRLRSNKEYSPFDLTLGLAIKVPVYFDAHERLQSCLKERAQSGENVEPEELVIPGLEELSLNADFTTTTETTTTTTTTIAMISAITSASVTNPHAPKLLDSNLSAKERRKLKDKAKRFDCRHGFSSTPATTVDAVSHGKAKSHLKRSKQRTAAAIASGDPKRKAVHTRRAHEAIKAALLTDDAFRHTASAEKKADKAAEAETRWEEGLSYFTTLDQLKERFGSNNSV
ncbi:hypothetical protein FB45DRAFT_326449 [Roridomyces roridus]|uniref:Ribosome biogenesis protein SLX9 n=1 Tax=Roridomyces roridus TaxID=1738132 RepID=A0AAD7B515_9AGAR|nr:hypothetical protein FB45DRAFT_326449 [Roridomyces roridus]